MLLSELEDRLRPVLEGVVGFVISYPTDGTRTSGVFTCPVHYVNWLTTIKSYVQYY